LNGRYSFGLFAKDYRERGAVWKRSRGGKTGGLNHMPRLAVLFSGHGRCLLAAGPELG